jgi:hypothetical protein
MTVGELQAQWANLDAQLSVTIAVNGTFVPVVGLTASPSAPFVVIPGKGKLQQSNRFSVDEEGILGHLARLGLGDDEIGEVLGRASESINKGLWRFAEGKGLRRWIRMSPVRVRSPTLSRAVRDSALGPAARSRRRYRKGVVYGSWPPTASYKISATEAGRK